MHLLRWHARSFTTVKFSSQYESKMTLVTKANGQILDSRGILTGRDRKESFRRMHVYSHRSLSALTCILVVLFFALSFNAYACLLPTNDSLSDAMGHGCSTPDEQPVSHHCDAFKTLGMPSADYPSFSSDHQSLCPEDTASMPFLVSLASHRHCLFADPIVSFPKDLLIKISVLRI